MGSLTPSSAISPALYQRFCCSPGETAVDGVDWQSNPASNLAMEPKSIALPQGCMIQGKEVAAALQILVCICCISPSQRNQICYQIEILNNVRGECQSAQGGKCQQDLVGAASGQTYQAEAAFSLV